MKTLKIYFATLLVVFTFLSPLAVTYANAQETSTQFFTDVLELDARTINNAEIAVWSGTNNTGYLIPKGARISFQINAYQYSPIDMIVYRRDENGEFVKVLNLFCTMQNNQGTSIYIGQVPETAYYAFGVRNYKLTPAIYDGWIICAYE
ncbi:hypothetical protein C8E03_101416 [Lachnotalea glycerini]|jgi:hypothetical protein|uniref:Uncharacterized protein n=1 Tax=Lachnotalea glycerini TaxID=1763509 RepID=A0A255I8Q7_9FIRM|nr:hypothetical protein [Lachnotalea glycerini]PXV95786.1 hypothetical protein C8E03_101416 [Lachnotalea glycerini]RDY33149.1 hypothetical protein CG710_001080 [Lachnotalea glycerini]